MSYSKAHAAELERRSAVAALRGGTVAEEIVRALIRRHLGGTVSELASFLLARAEQETAIADPAFDSASFGSGQVRRRSLFLLLLATAIACQSPSPPLDVVAEVDLDRYVGRWYEIASFPQRFQEGCVATTASYTRRDDGRIRVENECRDGSFDGDLRRVEGVAWVADPSGSQAKLKVQFFWPFRGHYWIIELDPEYRFAVVGHPSRNYLWILSRTRTMDAALYEALLDRIESHGFDVNRLSRTPQPSVP